MRKYVQVILVVLSVFSLISLLVYRHEYNKLRYVLQVLNFFGTPGGVVVNGSCAYNFTIRHYSSSQPPPAWQRISNTIYVYSAYYDAQENHIGVKAIAIGVLNENLNYGCYLWYENQETPSKGVFSFSGIPRYNYKTPTKNSLNSKYFGKTSKNKGYQFLCESAEASGNPIGVTFSKVNDDTVQAFIPVANVGKLKSSSSNATAICVMPLETPFLKTHELIEFLSFHEILGVKDFFVYGGENVYAALALLEKDARSNVNVYGLQWNYPFVTDYDLMRTVAEKDCLLRTKGAFEIAVPLAFNQFLVPKFHSNIYSILHDFDPEGKVPKFQFPVVLFCVEYKDDPKSTEQLPFVFRKSRYALPKSEVSVMVTRLPSQGNKQQKVSREIAAIHWYTLCDAFDLKVVDKTQPKFDHSILRFNSELLQSSILKVKDSL